MVTCISQELDVSERRACSVLGQARSTQRHHPQVTEEEERLVARIIELATQYGRYGYRRITAMLQQEEWKVNHKRVERLWRKEGLKVPQKQPKRGRIWLNDGSCIRLRPEHKDHVWSYDFMSARTSDGFSSFVVDNLIREYVYFLISKLEGKMGISNPGQPDPKVPEKLEKLIDQGKSNLRWYWRFIIIIVAISTVITAVFQVLTYFCR